jgi:hypothetical protein
VEALLLLLPQHQHQAAAAQLPLLPALQAPLLQLLQLWQSSVLLLQLLAGRLTIR